MTDVLGPEMACLGLVLLAWFYLWRARERKRRPKKPDYAEIERLERELLPHLFADEVTKKPKRRPSREEWVEARLRAERRRRQAAEQRNCHTEEED